MDRIAEKNDVAMSELARELKAATNVSVDPSSISRWLIRNGFRYKKTLTASERDRPDIRKAREEWMQARQPRMRLEPSKLIFIDETGTTTKMTRLRGRRLKGGRLRSKAPFGHLKTQTFIAGLRHDALAALFTLDAPMNRIIFETYVKTPLAPTLGEDDIVIMDNLSACKSAEAEKAIRERGAWRLFPPAYSPHLNPIEMAFSKLDTSINHALRLCDAV